MAPSARILSIVMILCAALLSSCFSTGGLLEDQTRTQGQADARAASIRQGSDEDTEEDAKPVLAISGRPSGAEIRVDGIYRGTSPLELALSAGSYRIEVSKTGWKSAQYQEYFPATGRQTLSYELEELTGTLRLSLDPPDARVSGSGLWTAGSGDHELRVGTHVLSVDRFGYAGKTITVSIYENEVSHESVVLEKKDLALSTSVSNPSFNPREPAALGRALIKAEPDSYGYARIRVLDPTGKELARRDFPFIEGPGTLSLPWSGRDAEGQPLPSGPYRAVFESWALRDPLPGEAFPDWQADRVSDESLSVVESLREPANLLAQLSGAAYCPDAAILDQSWQASLAAEGTFVDSGLWFAQQRLSGRLGILPRFELGSNLGFMAWPGRLPAFLFSLSGKAKLWSAAMGGGSFSGALGIRGNFFWNDVVVDPFAAPRGLGVSLPLQLDLGGLDLLFCPELALSPYRMNDPASVTASDWDHPWHPIPYARAGLRIRGGWTAISLSGFVRFRSLDQAAFVADPPYGAALELDLTDPKTGLRWGFSALCQFTAPDSYYLMGGLSLGYIGAL